MQVFFVISGYFSYMLFLRYPLKRWWKVRVERVGIPMLTAIPLLTLPQFIMLQHVKGKAENWPNLSFYEKYNTLFWELISHLWFLLVLVVLTTVSLLIFSQLRQRASTASSTFFANITLGQAVAAVSCAGGRVCRRQAYPAHCLPSHSERWAV